MKKQRFHMQTPIIHDKVHCWRQRESNFLSVADRISHGCHKSFLDRRM